MVTQNDIEIAASKSDKIWYVYLLLCADGTVYCGITTDITRRLGEHNRGRGARYTRGRAPIVLLGHAPFLGRGEAQRVEYRIKQQPTSRKLALLASLGGDGFVAHYAASAPAEGISWKKLK
ncbi:MAG: GIY-YIG nuclease family protein [Pseudomonadota bacterium]